MNQSLKAGTAALGLVLTSILSGCALENTAPLSTEVVPTTAIAGTVHGGNQPIFGARVYLLAVNPTGYGGPGMAASSSNASVSLLTTVAGSVTPDTIGYYATTNNTTGGFSLSGTGAYSCTLGYTQGASVPTVSLSGSEQVYLYILGGTPQNAGGANASAGMLVALGPCNGPSTQVAVNEVTTVATAYAFAGFATDATHIGSSGSSAALTSLGNAFANVANLAVLSAGTAAASVTGITRPTANVITIADILAACVNGTTANTSCGVLFGYTRSSVGTGTVPTDTATAAINLAHNPYPTANGVSTLYGLVPSTGAPFVGGLSSQPNDFTLGLNLTGAGLNSPTGIAIDASGRAWVSNYGSPSAGTGSSLSLFGSNGSDFSGSGGLTGGGLAGPSGVAIDASGNVWAPSKGNGSHLSKFNSSGFPLSGSAGYTGGGLDLPDAIAIDASGNVWLANNAYSSISEFSSAGSAISGSSGDAGGGVSLPASIAIDASGSVWVGNIGTNGTAGGSTISEFSGNGSATSPSTGDGGGGVNEAVGIAIGASGHVWVANDGYVSNSISEFSSTGSPISGSTGYTGGGLNYPGGIAVDGSGNVWVANLGSSSSNIGNSVSEFSGTGSAISGSTGYTGGGFSYAKSIAIDGSGNVWVTNNSNSVTELIGAASPLLTPLCANLRSPYGTAAVNRP